MKDFFRRHNRVITFLGALIVFATFIVKEGFRESLKNLTDSINNAENVFLIRSELQDLKEHTGTIGSAKSQKPTMHDFAVRDVESTRKSLENTGYQLDNISRLITALPDQNALVSFASSWRNESQVIMRPDGPITFSNTFELKQKKTLAAHWYVLRDQMKQYYDRDNKVRRLIHPDGSEDEEAAKAAAQLSGDSAYLLHVTHEFGQLVLGDAMKEKAQREHSYKIYTYISYFLYAFGSVLGLAGRLFGVPGLAES